MYAIVKKGEENINVVCYPGTGEPVMFDDMLPAIEWADTHGFSGPGVEVIDIDEEKLRDLS